MITGELRSYRIFGIPEGGGPAQDLTGLANRRGGPVILFGAQEGIADATGQAGHVPPTHEIAAQQPGKLLMIATLINTETKPARVPLEIADSASVDLAAKLRLDPELSSARIGEPLALPRAKWVSLNGDARDVTVDWESLTPNILAPINGAPGQFIAKARGQGRIRARYDGLEAEAWVNVVGDATPTINERTH